MAKIYQDSDVDMAVLSGKRLAVLGYGNQGRAQALNLRDSGLDVIVGNREDEYRERASADGFDVGTISAAAEAGDVLLMLIPDEEQPGVYESEIKEHLRARKVLCFASGYNIYYQKIEVPAGVDVIMVAPRMIGQAVRQLYQKGLGFPCLVAGQGRSGGGAMSIALAVAKGIGATRLGAFASSFEEETLIDLFAEQMLWPGIIRLCLLYFDKLVANGCDAEVVATELHLSGEFVEIAKAMISEGFFEQLKLHSQTSQYGQLSRAGRVIPEGIEQQADMIMDEIRSGKFAQEWQAEQAKGKPTLKKLHRQCLTHPLVDTEKKLESLRRSVARMYE